MKVIAFGFGALTDIYFIVLAARTYWLQCKVTACGRVTQAAGEWRSGYKHGWKRRSNMVVFIPQLWSWAPPGWRIYTPARGLELCFQSLHSPAGLPEWRMPAGWQVWNGLWCKPDAGPPASAAENPSAFDWCLLTAARGTTERKDTEEKNVVQHLWLIFKH